VDHVASICGSVYRRACDRARKLAIAAACARELAIAGACARELAIAGGRCGAIRFRGRISGSDTSICPDHRRHRDVSWRSTEDRLERI
jgi:hypothetical protein